MFSSISPCSSLLSSIAFSFALLSLASFSLAIAGGRVGPNLGFSGVCFGWSHAAIAVCSCTYTVCFYGVCTLAFAPTVLIKHAAPNFSDRYQQSTIDLLFCSTCSLSFSQHCEITKETLNWSDTTCLIVYLMLCTTLIYLCLVNECISRTFLHHVTSRVYVGPRGSIESSGM
jgi:hypothetical protein